MYKRAAVFWFTGLSGAGKSTLAENTLGQLHENGLTATIIDGDHVRARLHRHLGFSEKDIKENNALVAELCNSLRDKYNVILVPIISPYAESRRAARQKLAPDFFEVFVKASVATVVARDPKGLYALARAGKLDNLIGFSPSSPYEPPEHPDLVFDTAEENLELSTTRLVQFIRDHVLKSLENAHDG